MSSKNFYGLTGDVTIDGGILNVGNAQLYANTETSNVGIGTTNPEFELDVRGDANVENLYATYLHGDGSNIENIVSSQWEGSPGDPIYYASNVGIANTSPVTKTLQVGSNLYVEDEGSNVLHVTGNIYADYFVGDGSQLTGIAASLDQIVDQGNTVSNTIQIISGQDATSNVGLVTHEGVSISVSNANPTGEYQFGVGSNLLVNVYSSNVLTVDGNVFAQKMTLGTVTITPAYNLQHIMATGATSDQTLVLSNVTTGLTTTSNVGIANTAPVHTLDVGSNLYVEDTGSNVLTVTGNAYVSGDLKVGSNLYVEDTGSNVLTVTGNVSVSNRLDVGSNLHIENLRVAEVAANLVTYDSSTGELMDSAGLFSNKLAVVSEQPPVALTGASTLVEKHGTYTIEASSGTVVNLFDKVSGETNKWQTDDDPLNKYNDDGSYDGSASLVTDIRGEWAKITMPYKTILRHVKIESPNSSIKDVTLVGLNADGLTWSDLKTVTGLNEEISTIIVNATTHHRTYGLIVRATNIGSSQAEIGDLRLFTESFSIDGGKVEMASSAVMGGETMMDQHGPHGRGEAKLKKYPEIVFEKGKFDRNDSTNTYTQAGYTVTASNQNNTTINAAYGAFDGVSNDYSARWRTQSLYVDNTSTANPSALDPSSPQTQLDTNTSIGEYLIIELPSKIKLKNIAVNGPHMHIPYEVDIYGRNEGISTWTLVKNYTYAVPSGTNSLVWNTTNQIIDATEYYSEYAFVVVKTNGHPGASIGELELYGYEEDPPAGDTSVDTTFTSIMNTPQTTGAQVYVDGNLGETFTNRVTGPAPIGTSTTYDQTGKYWTLTGALTSNISVEANTFLEGDQPHTVSVWFNSSNLEANVSNTCVFSVSDQEKLDSVNLDLQSNTWHNLTYAYQGEGGSRVTYLDGRKVSEDQAEDTFGDYPPFGMTGYSQGGYVASASSDLSTNYDAWEVFDNTDAQLWICDDYNSDGTTPRYTGGITSSGGGVYQGPISTNSIPITGSGSETIAGEYIQIEFPFKFKLEDIAYQREGTYWGYNRLPHSGSIVACNDGINWKTIHNWTGLTDADVGSTDGSNLAVTQSPFRSGIFAVDKDSATYGAYKFFRIICTRIQKTNTSGDGNSYGLWSIVQLELYGHRENDLVRLPDPTNVLKYPHIAMTGPAQRGYVASASSVLYNGTNAQYQVWKAFDNTLSGNHGWVSLTVYNQNSPGEALSSLGATQFPTASGRYGEYIDLQLPHGIKVNKFIIKTRPTQSGSGSWMPEDSPGAGYLYGSNDGTTWTEIKAFSGLTYGGMGTDGGTQETVQVDSTTPYNYLRFQVTHRAGQNGSDQYVAVGELEYYGTGVDSIPIQIGGGNIDKVANFRVYDKFVGEDQALEIWYAQKDEFGRAKSSMTLQKGRLGIGTTEPEGRLAVADEPHNLEEFPPRAMTANETYVEGHGVFRASSEWTRNSAYEPFAVFNKYTNDVNTIVSQDRMWWSGGTSAAPPFSGNPGVFTGDTSKNIGGYTGVGLKLEMPYSILCNRIDLYPRNPDGSPPFSQNPRAFKFIASKDNEFWDLLHEETSFVDTGGHAHPFHINTTQYYKYFAIVVTGVAGNTTIVSIVDLQFFGTREQGQSVLHDGQLTLTKSLNVPRIGPALDADDTPRRDRLVVEYNTSTNPTFEGAVRDTSGRGNDGVFYGGASYDATEKALVINGGDQHIITNMNNKGDTDVSISFWIKRTADTDPAQTVVMLGTYATGTSIAIDIYDDGAHLYWWTQGGDHIVDSDGALQFPIGKWVHVTATRTGRVAGYKLYIDGVDWTPNMTQSTGATALTLPDNAQVTIGSRSDGTTYNTEGSISNFKLYDTALTAEEVKTLYDMGRCDEGHHVVNFSKTRVGIGLGDGEAPRGALDVRGGVNFHSLLASASGGAESQITDQGIAYKVHSFTSTGTSQITVDKAGFFECLVVAGGGAGGRSNAGGGGGGGVVIQQVFVHAGTYDVVVGAGNTSGTRDPGHGDTRDYNPYPTGKRGENSSVFGLLAIGGGNGGGDDYCGVDGGSGGGCADDNNVLPGRGVQNQEGSNGYGNRGGYTRINNKGGSGGGGAGEVGFDINPEYDYGEGNSEWYLLGRDGGNGVGSTIRTGSMQYYGGGGGGAQRTTEDTDVPGPGVGGKGGGGNGGIASGTGSAGSANTGGGGGGTSHNNGIGGNGGSGIVVVRYKI